MAFAQCELINVVAGIFGARDDRGAVNAPGDRSLVALVRSATVDPAGSILEFRAEAIRAQQACATADAFEARQYRARALRYARAAEIVEAHCAACAAHREVVSFDAYPGVLDAGTGPEPPPAS
jgi:hypothetical protein